MPAAAPSPATSFALTAGLLELKCGHKRYDHKKSSEMFCTMIKRGEGWWGGYTDASCFVPDAPCFYAGTIIMYVCGSALMSDLNNGLVLGNNITEAQKAEVSDQNVCE